MWHSVLLAAQDNPQAAGLILKGIKGIFVAIGSVIAAVVCGVIAAIKGRNPIGWVCPCDFGSSPSIATKTGPHKRLEIRNRHEQKH